MARQRKAWGDFLNAYEWDHLIHLTLRHSIGRERSVRAVGRFLRNLERYTRGVVPHYVALEPTTTDHWHAHGVLSGTHLLKCRDLQARWHGQSDGGHARITVYDPSRGGAWYSMKRQPEGFELLASRRLPPLRVTQDPYHAPDGVAEIPSGHLVSISDGVRGSIRAPARFGGIV